jgi:hypothetical protein
MAKSKVIHSRPKFGIGDIVYVYSNEYDEKTDSYTKGERIDALWASKTPTDRYVIQGVHRDRKGNYYYKTIEFHGTHFGYVGYEVCEYQLEKIGEI